jgi:hypothetical protein
MIDTNNENITKNQAFIQQMYTNDDTNMTTNDFDRYITKLSSDILVVLGSYLCQIY